MTAQTSTTHQNRLRGLIQQFSLSEKMLQNHPLVTKKFSFCQPLMHLLSLQMKWIAAGPLARLLMTFQSALQGQEINKSQTGFIGPAFQRLQEGVLQFMQLPLTTAEKEQGALLQIFTEMIVIGMFYAKTECLEIGKNEGIQLNEALFKELGLTFLLGSRVIESAFHSIAKEMGFQKRSQQIVTDSGVFFLLSLLILSEDEETRDEFEAIIKRFMLPTLASLEATLSVAQQEGTIQKEVISLAFIQLNHIRKTVSSPEKSDLKQALISSLKAFDLSFQEVKEDLRHLSQFCTQLNVCLKNIFYQNKLTTTTMIQSA